MCRFVSIFYILRFTERPSLQVRSGRRSVNPSVKPSVICVDLCLFFYIMRFTKRSPLQVRAQRTGSARAPHLQQGRTIFGGKLESTGFFATATVMTFGLKTAPMAGGGQAKGATRSVRSVLRGGGRVVRGGGGNDGDIDVDEVRLGFTHCVSGVGIFTFLVTNSRHTYTCFFGVCGEVTAAPCCD